MKFSSVSLLVLISILTLTGCSSKIKYNPLVTILEEGMEPFDYILNNPSDYRLQIIYTQVDRDSVNNPSLTTYTYRADKKEYFYPASMVKLPGAILALEKLNDLNIDGLSRFSPMLTDSAYSGQTTVNTDSTSETGLPSLDHYIQKIFLCP